MSALRFLMAQHDRVEALLVDLTQATGAEGKARALADFAHVLRQHFDVEETQFYAVVAPRLILVRADRFLEEHQKVRDLLAQLEGAPQAADYDQRVEELHDLLVRHVSDEEIELYPEVKRRFSVDELNEMGERIEQQGETAAAVEAEGPLAPS